MPGNAVRLIARSGRSLRAALVIMATIFVSLPVMADAAGRPTRELPLRISANERYFVDQNGRPFLIQGDSAWSLIAQLTLEQTEFYLSRRQEQGFNSIIVNLIEHKFSKNAPRNAAGAEPFLRPGDFSAPNEAYFAHADAVIGMAARKGMLVFLTPAYFGWIGTDEGWCREIRRAGPDKLRKYGRFVGSRLGRHPNIIWVIGGDYTSSLLDRWYADALAEGIREAGADQLMTAHCGQKSPAEALGHRRWLDFANIYSYASDLYRVATREFRRTPPLPFILLEALYEGEHDSSAETIRRQAYAALLGGAAGQFFGNNPIWNFGAPIKVFPSEQKWADALETNGALAMGHLKTLFLGLPWYELVPDFSNRHFDGRHAGDDKKLYPLAAATKDGRVFIAYLPGIGLRELAVDPAGLAHPDQAYWYDPTNGEKRPIGPAPFTGDGRWRIPVPGKNAAGAGDWVLVLQAARYD